jgi:phosphatidylinositol 4-kinase
MVRMVWQINSAIAVHLPERFRNYVVVRNEVTKLIRSATRDVLDTPEALPFLLGDRIDSVVRRDLKVGGLPWTHFPLTIFRSISFSGHLFLLLSPTPSLSDDTKMTP